MSPTSTLILEAIAQHTPLATGAAIYEHVNAYSEPTWAYTLWPWLDALMRETSLGGIYVRLDRLERDGLVIGTWGADRPTERGNRRRRYYHLTEAGRQALGLHISEITS